MAGNTQQKGFRLLKYILLYVFVLLSYWNRAQTTQTYSVTGTWTAPNCVTRVSAEVWGAGGGGAGNSTGADGGGGGAGGGYSRAITIPVTPGVTYTVTVGIGGAPGLMAADATADGGAGTESWFKEVGAVYANGGGGGSRPNSGLGGAGGAAGLTGTGGDATYAGGNGGSGKDDAVGLGGGGGSSAGPGFVANGMPGTSNGGPGGVAPAGGGNGGDGGTADGSPGLWPGGGGGGAGSNGMGGAGAAGKVFLDWTNGFDTPGNMTSASGTTVCSGVALAVGLASDAGASTFVWKASDNPNTSGESLTDQTVGTINDVITNNTDVVQTVTYTVIPTSAAGCTGNPQVVTAVINPNAFITLTSAVGTDSQIVCENTPITNITYTVTGGGTNAAVSALPAGVTGSFSGGLFTITGTPSVTGTFPYTITTTGNCSQTSIDGTIIVTPATSVVLTSILGSDNQSVCVNTPIVDITYDVGSGNTATASGLPPGVTDSFSGNTITLSGAPSVVGVHSYTITTTGVCPSQVVTGTITATPDGVLTLTSAPGTDNQTVCENTPIVDIVYQVSGGATGFTISPLPVGFGTVLGANTMTVSGQTAAAGTYDYTVITTGTCKQDTLTGSITITPTTAIALTSVVGSNNQVVCENDPILDITYNVGGGATVSTLPTGVTGSYSGGVFTISGTPTTVGNYTYTVTTTGPCVPPATAEGAITVNPDGVLTLTSATGTDNQTVCENTPIVDIVYQVSGGATGFTISPLPVGFGTVLSANTMTVSGQTAAAGTYDYTVITTGTCRPDTLTGSITITPTTAIALTSVVGSNNQVVCENDPILDITYNVGGGATVSTLPTGVTGSYSGGVFTISGTPTTVGNYTYTVTTTGPCVPPATAEGAITVNPDGVLTLTSATGTDNQTVCENTPIVDIVYQVSGGATGFTISPLPVGFGTVLGANTMTVTGQTAAAGTYDYTVISTGTCRPDTLTGSITITPTTAIALTSVVGSNNQVVCENDPIVDITYNVGGGATVSTLPAGVTGSYSGGVFTISGTPTTVGNYTYTVTTTGPCVPPATAEGAITVNPDGVLTLTSATGTNNQTVCESTPIVDITYQVSGGATGFTISPLPLGFGTTLGPNTMTISGQTAVTGTYDYTVISTGSCVPDTLTGSITVSSSTSIVLSSAPGTDNQTICENAALTAITYSVTGASTAAASPLPTGVTGNYSGGVFTISGTPTVAGTYTYTVSTTGGCSLETATGSITVNQGAAITLTSAVGTDNQNICINNTITDIVYTVSGNASSASVSTLPTGVTSNYTSGVFTISGTPTVAGNYDYTVTATGSCSSKSLTGKIQVNTGAAISLTSAAGTDAQTVCENIALTPITYSITGGATPAVTALPTGVTSNYAAGLLTISGAPNVAGTYNYTVSASGGCPLQSTTGTITVNPNATIALTSANGTDAQNVCINITLTDITYSVGGGATNASVSTLPAGVSGSYNAGVFTITGTPSVAGHYDYTVTTTGSCAQQSATGSIIVNTGATLALSSATGTDAQTVCANAPITNITYAIGGGATGATVSTLPAGINGNYASGVFTISGTPTTPGVTSYTVSTTGTCPEEILTGTITVNQSALIALTSASGTDAQSICLGTAINNITYSISGSGTGATVSPLPTGVTGSYNAGVFTITGTPTVTGSFDFTVTPTGSCVTQEATGTIVVNEDAVITLTSAGTTTNQTVCENTAISNIVYTVSGGATSAAVSPLPTGVSGSFNAGVFTITGTPTTVGAYTYTVTTSGNCAQVSASGSINVNPLASIHLTSAVSSATQTLCVNTAITAITYSVTGASSATVTPLPAGLSSAYNAGVLSIIGTPTAAGVKTFTVSTIGGCGLSSLSGGITVKQTTMTLTSTTGTKSQLVCLGTALTTIKYNIAGATSANVTPLPAGVSGVYAAGAFTISGTPSAIGVRNYTVTTTGGCAPVKATGSFTVTQTTLSLTSAVETTSQTLCSNNSISDIIYAVGGSATGAKVTPSLPSNLSATGTSSFKISGALTNLPEGNYTYTVSTTGGTCPSKAQTFSITVVNPVAKFDATPVSGKPGLISNFTNKSEHANTYAWDFGNSTQAVTASDTMATYATAGNYKVQLIASNNSQCPDTAYVDIEVSKFETANIFSPNGDGVNDVFAVDASGLKNVQVEVYNRWGNMVYESEGTVAEWNGENSISKKLCEAGTYYYIIKKEEANGEQTFEKGYVTIVR